MRTRAGLSGLMMTLLVAIVLFRTNSAASQTITTGNGALRLAHFAVNAASIDAYVDGQPVIHGLRTGKSTALMTLSAGMHTLVIVAAGKSPDEPLVAPVTIDIQPNHRYSAAVIGQADHLKLLPVDETTFVNNPDATQEKLHVVSDSGGMLKFKPVDPDDRMAAA